jgi:tetratricopeptide (TPR) repeat protein
MARYAEARAALRKAGQLVPSPLKHGVYAQWGHFYTEKNDLKRAETWYRRALAAKRDTRHYIFLGAVLAKQGRLAQAAGAHRSAIKCATPGQAVDEALLNLGLIYRSERQYRLATVCFKRALKIDPGYSLATEALRDVRKVVDLRRAG